MQAVQSGDLHSRAGLLSLVEADRFSLARGLMADDLTDARPGIECTLALECPRRSSSRLWLAVIARGMRSSVSARQGMSVPSCLVVMQPSSSHIDGRAHWLALAPRPDLRSAAFAIGEGGRPRPGCNCFAEVHARDRERACGIAGSWRRRQSPWMHPGACSRQRRPMCRSNVPVKCAGQMGQSNGPVKWTRDIEPVAGPAGGWLAATGSGGATHLAEGAACSRPSGLLDVRALPVLVRSWRNW
jgi:hypothetical protein